MKGQSGTKSTTESNNIKEIRLFSPTAFQLNQTTYEHQDEEGLHIEKVKSQSTRNNSNGSVINFKEHPKFFKLFNKYA